MGVEAGHGLRQHPCDLACDFVAFLGVADAIEQTCDAVELILIHDATPLVRCAPNGAP